MLYLKCKMYFLLILLVYKCIKLCFRYCCQPKLQNQPRDCKNKNLESSIPNQQCRKAKIMKSKCHNMSLKSIHKIERTYLHNKVCYRKLEDLHTSRLYVRKCFTLENTHFNNLMHRGPSNQYSNNQI